MREITDGLCKFALCSLPFWIVLMNVTFVAFRVNSFLRYFPAFGPFLIAFFKTSAINLLINGLQGKSRYEIPPCRCRFTVRNSLPSHSLELFRLCALDHYTPRSPKTGCPVCDLPHFTGRRRFFSVPALTSRPVPAGNRLLFLFPPSFRRKILASGFETSDSSRHRRCIVAISVPEGNQQLRAIWNGWSSLSVWKLLFGSCCDSHCGARRWA
jgi:hypothetical protein